MRYAPNRTPEKKRTIILTGLLVTNITLTATISSHTTVCSVVIFFLLKKAQQCQHDHYGNSPSEAPHATILPS